MMLECDGIQFGYGGRSLLSDIYVKAETGKVVGLLGRNGCGKSTLLKIVFGSMFCETRSVRIDQQAVGSPAFASKEIAYFPQTLFIPAHMSLQKALMLYGIEGSKLFESFPELEADLTIPMRALSGGRQRLAGLLLALNLSATFYLLDEPFNGLAPVIVERVMAEIERKKKDKGIVITDHRYYEVEALSDGLYVLLNGKTHRVNDAYDLVRYGYLSERA